MPEQSDNSMWRDDRTKTDHLRLRDTLSNYLDVIEHKEMQLWIRMVEKRERLKILKLDQE